MRFLYINPLPFPTTRAYGVQLIKMADALIAQGHEVELWIPSYGAEFPGAHDRESLKIYFGVTHFPIIKTISIPIDSHRSWGFGLLNKAWYKLLTFIYARNVRQALKRVSEEAVIITRDSELVYILKDAKHHIFWELHSLGKTYFTERALCSVDGIFPINHFLQEACLTLGFPTQASQVLPSGVDVEQFMLPLSGIDARRKLGLDQLVKIYGFSGRFQESWKGRDVLLGIASHLNPNERLYLVGDFSNGINLFIDEAKKRGVDLTGVIFAGHVAPSEVPTHLAACDVLLVPNSSKEPIGRDYTSPLKLFEYLASGRPVVAANVSAIREVIDDTCAVLFEPDQPLACLEACRSIAGDSERSAALVNKGTIRVREFDWKNRAKIFLDFVQRRLKIERTVIVPIYDGVISKNIVDSGALQGLIDEGYRVLLWVYEAKADYYRKRYGPKGYIVAEYGQPRIPLWATNLQNFAIDCIPTRALYLKHLRRAVAKKKYILGFFRILIWFFGHFVPIRFVIQRLTLLWRVPLKIRALVRVERPVMVFCPTMVWLAEVQLVRFARKQGIKTMGMDKSWDNITSKLILPVWPDKLAVPNLRCKEEAIQYLAYPKERIIPVGLPQFDRYVDPSLYESREAFFARMGLDPNKRILLYCAAGLWMAKDETEILKWLDEQIESGVFGSVQVLVRLHPKYDCGADQLEQAKHLILDRPGTYITKEIAQWEYEDADLKHLLSSIRFANVTINTASTMSIEAAYFDRPIINIGIDPKPVPYALSVKRYYEREHYKPILDAGGAKLVTSYEDLSNAIRQYLAHPEEDHQGRDRIVLEQCMGREPIAGIRLRSILSEYVSE